MKPEYTLASVSAIARFSRSNSDVVLLTRSKQRTGLESELLGLQIAWRHGRCALPRLLLSYGITMKGRIACEIELWRCWLSS